jgi:hypothetical protein
MATEDPYISEFAERRAGWNLGHHICRVIVALRRLVE